jgi:hypothetical protein
VAKKKPAKKSAKKPARKMRAAAPRRKTAPAQRKVQMKPIKMMIDRAIADLQRLPPTESTDITLRNLQTCAAAFGDICDPNTPGGCSPTMEFLL